MSFSSPQKKSTSNLKNKSESFTTSKSSPSYDLQSNQTRQNILDLQQTLGNQEIQRLIKSGILQPKLKISQPNDPYEREADRIAEQIMRISVSQSETNLQNNLEDKIHRKFPTYDMKKEDELKISRKSVFNDSNLEASDEISNQINNVSGGKPLDDSTKSFMESRFNHDFSNVRIHDDSKSQQLSRVVNARAFTTGNNIFLGKDESVSDKRLMAHELVHVVQQNSSTDSPHMKNDIKKTALLSSIHKKDKGIQRTLPTIITNYVGEWIAVTALGFALTNGIAGAARGDIHYTFARMRGVMLPGGGTNTAEYRTQNPNRQIFRGVHRLAVWFGQSWWRKMGITFDIYFNYDNHAIGKIDMGIVERHDELGWKGDVNMSMMEDLSGGIPSVQIIINLTTDNHALYPNYEGHIVFMLRADGHLIESSHGGDSVNVFIG